MAPPLPSGRLRALWNAIIAGIGALVGLTPHVLHHVGFLAGSALIAGAGGTILFGAVGLVASVPFLLRLRRRFGTWRAPALALGIFAAMFTVSALVIGPAIDSPGGTSPPRRPRLSIARQRRQSTMTATTGSAVSEDVTSPPRAGRASPVTEFAAPSHPGELDRLFMAFTGIDPRTHESCLRCRIGDGACWTRVKATRRVEASVQRRSWVTPRPTAKERIMAKDPVCGMDVEETNAAATSEYQGRTFYFCSQGCKREFDDHPEKYETA